MATRFYLPSSGSADVTPSSWIFPNQANGLTLPAVTSKTSSAMTTKTESTGTTNPTTMGLLRFVYGPLSAQTISGTLKGQIRCSEGNTGANATVAVAAKIIQPNGADRATLLAVSASTNTAATPPEMAVLTLTNRRLLNASDSTPISLTSQSATAGDYLVIELGWRSATGTNRNASLRYGDTGATDLAEDDTTTTDNVPWVEFSGTILPLITGSAAVTQGADTDSAAGTVAITGSAAVSQAEDTPSAAGSVAIAGDAAPTQGADTLSSDGTVVNSEVTGSASIAQADDSLRAGASVDVTGGLAQSQQPDSLAADGSVAIAGDLVSTQGSDSPIAAADVSIAGTTAATQSADSLSAQGNSSQQGDAVLVQGGDEVAAAGSVAISGGVDVAQAAQAVIASGPVAITGQANNAQLGDFSTASGGIIQSVTFYAAPTLRLFYPSLAQRTMAGIQSRRAFTPRIEKRVFAA